MKLHNHTLQYLSIALLLIVAFWGFFFYVTMKEQLDKSLDQRLANHKIDIIRAIQQDTSLLTKSVFLGYTYRIQPLPEQEALAYRDEYRSGSIFFQTEGETVPARKLITAFRLGARYYRLELVTSTLETDDLQQKMLYAVIVLYIALLVSIFFVNNLLLRRVWEPFYALIRQLDKFRLGHNQAFEVYPTKVSEFQSLNQTLSSLIDRAEQTYQSQKQFIENAAHELQTPVAISLNKLELLLEKEQMNEEMAGSVGQVIRTLERLARLNRSLLLLTKIENKQFQNAVEVNFNEVAKTLVHDFDDLSRHKEVSVRLQQEGPPLIYSMNLELAEILFLNLLKNALVHNIKKGEVLISLKSDTLRITNTGSAQPLDEQRLFRRFYKQSDNRQSTGLGLAIVKAIVDLYGLDIHYSYEEEGTHSLEIRFPIDVVS